MRKVCVVTGTRAEYGLLYWLMKEIENEPTLELQIIVTGMHLSPEHGLTYKEIEKDFKIDEKIEMNLSSDTDIAISKAMGLAQASFSEAYVTLNPDIVIVLGDRYEIFSAVISAMIARIPIAHLHGGESTEGAIDESIRHAITKMSHLHFTATQTYAQRVIQLGEQPDYVFNVGGLGIDNINKLALLSRDAFEKSIDFKLNTKNILITFHPVTLENSTAKEQFSVLLESVDKLHDTHLIFTKANSDMEGRIINTMIDEYVSENADKAVAFTSLGQVRYLSALQWVDVVLGNSSSGLLEAPSFKVATIDVGNRQKGRIKARSIISSSPHINELTQALKKALSPEFKESISDVDNPYGKGGASLKIKNIISKVNLEQILKKSFFDL